MSGELRCPWGDENEIFDQFLKSDLEEKFRTAIIQTAPSLSSNCYNAAHTLFASLWSIFFGIGFLIYTGVSSGRQVYSTAIGIATPVMVVLVVVIFFRRSRATWRLWKTFFYANVAFQKSITFLLRQPALIREASQLNAR